MVDKFVPFLDSTISDNKESDLRIPHMKETFSIDRLLGPRV